MHSRFASYLTGLLRVAMVLLRVALQSILRYLAGRAASFLVFLGGVLTLLMLAHRVLPGPLASWYAALEKKQSSLARGWRSFDALCSRNFCRHLLPSPIRHYELHIKEEQGFAAFIAELKAENAKLPPLKNAPQAVRYVRGFLPNRADFYLRRPGTRGPENISAIYLTGTSARPGRVDKYLDFSRAQGLTGVVFDVKDVYGFVNYRSDLPEVRLTQGKTPPPLGELMPLVAYFKNNKFYTIARIALFQDELQATKFPERQIKLRTGVPLKTKGRTVWVDPNKKAVQDYNLAIIREVLQAGVDEIQLDYVRYPAEGDWRIAEYHGLKDASEKPLVLGAYLQRVHALTQSYGAYLSLDVFGVVAWQEPLDIRSTGQDMHILSQTADVISPMLYPSHFGYSFGGIKNPADKPALFYEEGVKKLREIASDKIIRPWVQAFQWRVSRYSPQYITEQIRGLKKAGGRGYLLWNAGNFYERFKEP
ncbi:MAG: hypothetical protein OHK0011_12120 [Turneriella sp.]